MAKKKARPKTAKRRQSDEITQEKLLGYFTAAYVLDAVGLLDPEKRRKLDSLKHVDSPTWHECVEETFGINRTFVRSVYALCTEINSPPLAVTFILRGIGCPDYQNRLQEVLGLV